MCGVTVVVSVIGLCPPALLARRLRLAPRHRDMETRRDEPPSHRGRLRPSVDVTRPAPTSRSDVSTRIDALRMPGHETTTEIGETSTIDPTTKWRRCSGRGKGILHRRRLGGASETRLRQLCPRVKRTGIDSKENGNATNAQQGSGRKKRYKYSDYYQWTYDVGDYEYGEYEVNCCRKSTSQYDAQPYNLTVKQSC